jgi:CRISPR-associated protein Csx10
LKQLYIRLSTISPLAIRSDHAPGGVATANYIPGTTLAGALATVHRLLRPEKTNEFEQWFLSSQILYPNLYPAIFDDPGLQDRNHLPVYPIPKTARTCKRHKGFLFPQKEGNDAHGVRDSLLDWAVFELGQRNKYKRGGVDPLAALETHKECGCGERMDSFEGYYRRNDIVPNQLIAAQEYKRLRTHSGIDRRSGIVQEGILYSRQVFEEGMRFWGMATFLNDENLISGFTRFIGELGDRRSGHEGLLRMGTGRTRGMGKVVIDVRQPKDEQDSFELFQERLKEFNELLHGQAGKFNLSGLDNVFFFALTLHSPLILHDEFLRCRGNIDTSTLEKLLGCSIPELERIYQNAGIQRVTGWQELWGVPRTNEYAIETGSVFLFACVVPPGDAVYKALFELEEHGAGERRAEGFGRIRVSYQPAFSGINLI